MNTITYASVGALPWSAESKKHPVIPEPEFVFVDLSSIASDITESQRPEAEASPGPAKVEVHLGQRWVTPESLLRYVAKFLFEEYVKLPFEEAQNLLEILTGKPYAVCGIATDITALKRAEEMQAAVARERELFAQQRATELAKANEALLGCLDALASVPELDDFLGQVMAAITRQLDAVSSSLAFRFNEERTFDPEELEIARALATQASLAIQLTRLAKSSRQSAVLEERNRLAAEIHDTLAQSFTGISMQLELAQEEMAAKERRHGRGCPSAWPKRADPGLFAVRQRLKNPLRSTSIVDLNLGTVRLRTASRTSCARRCS